MCNLFKLLLDVSVGLQFELPASVGPVHQEQPLLGVHLFDQNGRFLVVPQLKRKYMSFQLRFSCYRPFVDKRESGITIFFYISVEFTLFSIRKKAKSMGTRPTPAHRSHHLVHSVLPMHEWPLPTTCPSPRSPVERNTRVRERYAA